MKAQMIKRLRERSNVKGKQKTWISTINDEQLYELFLHLRNGESARSIAQDIQKKWKLNVKGDIHSIAQGISKFGKRIEDLLQASLVPAKTNTVEETRPKLEEDTDDLLALERVVKLQRERVERMMKEEKELGIKHPNLSRDIQSLAALNKSLLKEKEFAIHHQIDPVEEREKEIRDRRIDKNFNTWMGRLTEENKERIVRIADRFLQTINDISISVREILDENGNFVRYGAFDKDGNLLDDPGPEASEQLVIAARKKGW